MPRGFHKSPYDTRLRNFKDKRSFVSMCGHDLLYGKDWEARKAELWARDGGKCQFEISYLWTDSRTGKQHESQRICSKTGSDPHHIEKGTGQRHDDLTNLSLLCRAHHDFMHRGRRVRWSSGEKTP